MMLIGGSVMFLILVVLIIFILTSCIRIVPQAQAPWRLSGNIWCRYPFYGAIY